MGMYDNLTPEQLEKLYQEANEDLAWREKEWKDDVVRYWKSALIVVNDWAAYQAAKKLYINASHEETKYRVQKVVDKYYGGKASKVKNRENELSGNVDLSIDMFQSVCVENHVEMINREWLYDYLKDSNDYEKLRRKIERKMKNFYEPISLREMV